GSTVISLLQRQARRLVFKQAKGKGTVMKFLAPFTKLAAAFRKFAARRYRPELYYMRGPGPATARRAGTHAERKALLSATDQLSRLPDGVLGDIGISRDEIMCALRSRATRPAEAFAHARSPRRENDAIPGESPEAAVVGHFEIAEQGVRGDSLAL
ncbi:hypothetical protein, partial [Mesorhizobium sp.]|uniref:hypothetical protein n=1 Tax=Mesorhizobium sp. TaxID=1871066 RepID=UPI002579C24C